MNGIGDVRAAQPFEIAPTRVYLASGDSAYVTGQVMLIERSQKPH